MPTPTKKSDDEWSGDDIIDPATINAQPITKESWANSMRDSHAVFEQAAVTSFFKAIRRPDAYAYLRKRALLLTPDGYLGFALICSELALPVSIKVPAIYSFPTDGWGWVFKPSKRSPAQTFFRERDEADADWLALVWRVNRQLVVVRNQPDVIGLELPAIRFYAVNGDGQQELLAVQTMQSFCAIDALGLAVSDA